MNQQIEIQFAQVTPEILDQFLSKATSRIVIAKAGYSKKEVQLLIDIVSDKKISCSLYMEAGENPVRYGFGQADALPLIHKNLDILNVQSVNQIRMALVIVDDAALVYTPVALSWEEPPDKLEFPNGIFGNKEFAEILFKQMGGEIVTINMDQRDTHNEHKNSASVVIPVPPVIPQKTPD